MAPSQTILTNSTAPCCEVKMRSGRLTCRWMIPPTHPIIDFIEPCCINSRFGVHALACLEHRNQVAFPGPSATTSAGPPQGGTPNQDERYARKCGAPSGQ